MGKRKCWSEEEVNYLMEHWGSRSLDKMARKLGRTEKAIINKVKKLKLGPFEEAGDMITVWHLVQALGIENTGSIGWYKDKLINNGLPVKELKGTSKIVYKIKIDDFFKWAEKNKRIVNFAKFERGALGKEPEWVEEKRNTDRQNPNKATPCKKWTKSEDSLLISMVKSYRYTYKELAKELNRTEGAIRRRLHQLGTYYRPVEAPKEKWTTEEVNRMKELYLKGYDTYTIAKELNKYQTSMSSNLRRNGVV